MMTALLCALGVGGCVCGAEMSRLSGDRLAATWWYIAAAVIFAALMGTAA